MERPLAIRLHVISPLHIGCGEVYEPSGFVLDESKGKITTFDPIDFVKMLSSHERERFSNICGKGDISAIIMLYKFMSSFAGRVKEGRDVDVAPDFVRHFNEIKRLPAHDRKKIRDSINRFEIRRTACNPFTGLPYIPGSSLKGSLRTACLNSLAKKRGVERYWEREGVLPRWAVEKGVLERGGSALYNVIRNERMGGDFEKHLMKGTFASDPFRMVKVSDFMPVGEVRTKIVYAVNRKKEPKKESKPSNLHQIVEVILPGAVFEGTVHIEKAPEGIREPVVWEESEAKKYPDRTAHSLKGALADFYIPLVNEENRICKSLNIKASVVKTLVEEYQKKIGLGRPGRALPVRIGMHSGAEAVTVEGNRMIKIMGKKGSFGKIEDHATTIWLASESRQPENDTRLEPFGWAVMEVLR